MRPRLARVIVGAADRRPGRHAGDCGVAAVARRTADYDPSAIVACSDFRRLVRDVGDGVLTPEDFRARVRSIQGLARLADPAVAPGVAENAATLLRAATTGTADDAVAAIDLMKHACSLPGAKLR